MIKHALIFNPYFDTLGGGEYFVSQVMDCLLKHDYCLNVAWHEQKLINNLNNRFGINLPLSIKIDNYAWNTLKSKGKLVEKYLLEKGYQLIFWVSDGSIPLLWGRKNWLLFQAPFHKAHGESFINKIKQIKIDQIFCYSHFVKKIIDNEFEIKSQVVFPFINPRLFSLKPLKKEKIILSVGRFDELLNAKKQEILAEAFIRMIKEGITDWNLILAGGLLDKNNPNYLSLLDKIKNYPIKIITNIDYSELIRLYQKSAIYWQATGYGEDLLSHPEKAEHFGLAVLEAKACGANVLVFNGGGLREIIEDASCRWDTLEELVAKTKTIIKKTKLSRQNCNNTPLIRFQQRFYQQLDFLIRKLE